MYFFIHLINNYLKESLQRVIRSGDSATYYVTVNNYFNNTTSKNCGYEVSFECDPERIEELNNILNLAITLIAENGMTQVDLDILKKMDKGHGHSYGDNISYINKLINYTEFGEDRSAHDFHQSTLDSIDLEFMNSTLKSFFNKAAILHVNYLPQ